MIVSRGDKIIYKAVLGTHVLYVAKADKHFAWVTTRPPTDEVGIRVALDKLIPYTELTELLYGR